MRANLGTLKEARYSQLVVVCELLDGEVQVWHCWHAGSRLQYAGVAAVSFQTLSSLAAAHCNGKGCEHYCSQSAPWRAGSA